MNAGETSDPRVLKLQGLAMPPGGAILVHHAQDVFHLGLWVSDLQEEGWLLHMDLRGLHRETEWSEPAWFVVPANSQRVLTDVCQAALLLVRANKVRKIPYGFDDQGLTLDPDGQLTLQDGAGLSCASLLLLLFEMANAPLLERGAWREVGPTRRDFDRAHRVMQIKSLQSRSPEMADRLIAQLTAPRFRPEEVAAASGMSGTPLTLGQVQRGASALREAIGLADNGGR